MFLQNINLALCRLVASFLDSSSFWVLIGIVLSERRLIGAGIPQGSVLSPVLYNIYTKDILTQMANISVLNYADDTAIVSYSKHQTWVLCVFNELPIRS